MKSFRRHVRKNKTVGYAVTNAAALLNSARKLKPRTSGKKQVTTTRNVSENSGCDDPTLSL